MGLKQEDRSSALYMLSCRGYWLPNGNVGKAAESVNVEFSRETWGLKMRLTVMGMQATVIIQSLSRWAQWRRKEVPPQGGPSKGVGEGEPSGIREQPKNELSLKARGGKKCCENRGWATRSNAAHGQINREP